MENLKGIILNILGVNNLNGNPILLVVIIALMVTVGIFWIVILISHKSLSSKNSFTFKALIINLILTITLVAFWVPIKNNVFTSAHRHQLIIDSVQDRYVVYKAEFEEKDQLRLYHDENTSIVYAYHILDNQVVLDYPKIGTRIRKTTDGQVIPENIEELEVSGN